MMAGYHEAVCSALSSLKWVKQAADYPEEQTALVTPAVYMTVNGWHPVSSGTGQLRVVLDVDLFVVCDRAASDEIARPEIYARAAAADLSQWLDGQLFGLSDAEPAVFTEAVRDAFDPAMDDYLVFRVAYTQVTGLGADPFAPGDGAGMRAAWLGKAPDIGSQHVNDYALIWRERKKT